MNEILIQCCRFFLDKFFSALLGLFNSGKKDLHVFVLDMMDDRDDDDDNDDGDQLDFYDFLDIIGDKFDSIAQQSNERDSESMVKEKILFFLS